MILHDRLSAAEQDRCMTDMPKGNLFWLFYLPTVVRRWEDRTMLWRRCKGGVRIVLGEFDKHVAHRSSVKPLGDRKWCGGNGILALDEGETARVDMLLALGHSVAMLRAEAAAAAIAQGRISTEAYKLDRSAE